MCSTSSTPNATQNGDVESNFQAGEASPGKGVGLKTGRVSASAAFLVRLCRTLGRFAFAVIILGSFVALLWYLMGVLFVIQLTIVAIVAYLAAGGGYKWFYIAFKTAPRDLLALSRYLLFLMSVWSYSRRNISVGQIFRENAKRQPNKVCFIFEDRQWTMGEVEEYSNKIANLFRSHGYRKGDTIALMLENRPEFVCIWLGLAKLGAVTALINTNLRSNSLLHSVNVAKAQAFIFGEDFTDAVKEISPNLAGVRLYSFSPNEPRLPRGELAERQLYRLLAETTSAPPAIEDITFHDRMLYIYTSGTTGLPKAAVITHARYVFLAGAISYLLWFKKSDIFYTPLPLYHTAGGAMSIGQAIIYGSSVVIRRKFSASSYFADIAKYNCTISQYIGEMCRYLLATPTKPTDTQHKLRMVFGNGLRPQIWEDFTTRFNVKKVGEFYGATEGNANIVNIDSKLGAIGFISRIVPTIYPVSVIKVDELTGEPVRNAKGLCIICQPNESGVFIGKIQPSNPARAYLGYVNEKESQKKIVYDVFRKGDSAFISGDIVTYDESGYIYFKDRTGDTFRWKGENVSTAEVEGVVSNLVDFKDCVIYGVEVPGSEGRAGMAAIVDKEHSVNINKLAEGVKKSLPPYARPIFVRILQEVELTGTYKMKKLDLQKEGFNPQTVQNKLYFLSPTSGSYEVLTSDLYSQIESGKIRF